MRKRCTYTKFICIRDTIIQIKLATCGPFHILIGYNAPSSLVLNFRWKIRVSAKVSVFVRKLLSRRINAYRVLVMLERMWKNINVCSENNRRRSDNKRAPIFSYKIAFSYNSQIRIHDNTRQKVIVVFEFRNSCLLTTISQFKEQFYSRGRLLL